MRLHGPRRSEWILTALVLVTSAVSCWRLHRHASAVDDASARRRVQLEQLAELSGDGEIAPDRVRAVDGLFARHEVVVERAPWGSVLALRPAAAGGVQ